MFKVPHVRHPQQLASYQDNHSSSIQSTYSHLEQFHKVDQQERPLGVDPEETFQSHAHNHIRNFHSNNARQQRRNSLNIENVPQSFRRGLTGPCNGIPKNFSSSEQNKKMGNREETADGNRVSSTLRSKSKRKEASSDDPLQVMMSRRCKRRV